MRRIILAAAVALAATACTGSQPHDSAACPVVEGALPAWAQSGFTPPDQSVPHVLGAGGDIAAILFGQPLRVPAQPDRSNKILWVSRPASDTTPLKIQAKLNGSDLTVDREVADGPGPSAIDLPKAGCWTFDLTWSGHTDRVDIPYTDA
jgi:hypothetical protein